MSLKCDHDRRTQECDLGDRSLRPRRIRQSSRALATRSGSKCGAFGRCSRLDRGFRRRLRHDHLWRLCVVHEWEHHSNRLSDGGGRVWPRLAIGAGDPVLRRRIVRRDPASRVRRPLCAEGLVLRGRSRARGDHRPDQFGMLSGAFAIAAISVAMGVMNNALSRVGAQAVSLTFVTGSLSRVGSSLALALRRAPLRDAQGPWDTHLRRALLLARLWLGFLVGAFLSGAVTPRYGASVLLAPALILAVLAAFDRPDGGAAR